MGTKKTAVLLMNLGGPDSLEAVEPFLFNLFSDKEIIRLPLSFLLQKFIAKRISVSRAKKVIPRYEEIGGRSPINEITSKQAAALQDSLNGSSGDDTYIVRPVMRYYKPYTKDVIDDLVKEGITDIVAVTLYPHYSRATTGSSVNELNKVIKRTKKEISIKYVERYPDNQGYINALCKRISDGLNKFPEGSDVHILFSAHSLPVEFIEKGDPYCDEINKTISLIKEKLGPRNYHLSYQSRSGPVKWLEPPSDKTIERLCNEGVKDILVVPISFVSDHIETLHEIDIMFKELAVSNGVKNFIRTESFNDSEDFIEVLKGLVLQSSS
jgi:ferrochelatase